jgi:tetratricopeptide (TPR) repeat protein
MANQILRDPEMHSPLVVVEAAAVAFGTTREMAEPDASNLFRSLIPILTKTLPGIPEGEKRSVHLMGLILLALCHEHLGETNAALDYYSRGLRVDPSHDALLTGRGILTYGKSSQSPLDLEQAIKLGSSLVWPYFFLAHHYILNNRYEDCRRVCERGMQLEASPAVLSQLSEWLAIAEAELDFPAARVRSAFEEALRLDPTNDTARRNLEKFEQALPRRMASMAWEKRSENSVRAFGQAERRLLLAA